jgi:hypothetical protein
VLSLRAVSSLATAVALLAVTAGGASGSARKERALAFAVSLDAVQTTSWTAHGSYAWCAGSTDRLPFDGGGQATLRLSLPADAHGAATPGAAVSLATTLGGTVERSGSYVEHDGAVASRPLDCPVLEPTDVVADTSGCGRKAAALRVTLTAGTLRSQPGPTFPSGCPWMTNVHEDASPDTVGAILDHVEASDGLAPVALSGFAAPRAPAFAPVTIPQEQTQTWTVDIPGGTLTVTTTTQVHARLALLALIEPGRSIAGVRLGETLAELRRATRDTGGLAIGDEGDLASTAHRWEWHVDAGVPYTDARGNRLYEDVWVSAPAGRARSTPARRIVVTHRRPPASARVTRVGTVSTVEVTKDGLGEGSTLTDLRRALPHGKLVRFGGPIAWLVTGPGRHRTAFMLFRSVVQSVQIGCRQTDPAQRGAPIDPAALC